MYYYILDPRGLSSEKFEKYQIILQGLLAEFKIAGEMARVTSLRSIGDFVETAGQRGAKTLVAAGSDDSSNLMFAYLQGRDLTLGFIPFDEESYLGKILGVETLPLAVKTIAARRIEKIDLATVNKSYFISSLEFGVIGSKLREASLLDSLRILSASAQKLTIRIDDSYSMSLECLGGLVVNTRSTSSKDASIANPTDGYLDLLILEPLNKRQILQYRHKIIQGRLEEIPNTSVIRCRRVEFLEPFGANLVIAGKVVAKYPATVEIIPLQLRMIVGKNRTF